MVGNSNRDSAFSSEKFTDSLQTESSSRDHAGSRLRCLPSRHGVNLGTAGKGLPHVPG